MVDITALWLPILVSAVIVFIVSSLIHTVLPWHKGDYPKVPDEEKFRAAVRPLAIPPGDYMVPRCDTMAEMKSAAFAEKMTQGPVMILTVRPNGPPSMTGSLIGWFIYSIVVGVFAAFVAGRALNPGTGYRPVFHFVAITAFACYAMALAQSSIWYGRSWRVTLVSMFDGLIYALLTAGTFGWLWPK